MQLDGTLQLPDGKEIAVVLEVDATQLEAGSPAFASADVVARLRSWAPKSGRLPGFARLFPA
jgi:hypothetical protein